MCGIAGALNVEGDPAGAPITEELVTRMRDALAHRGPDGARTWVRPDGRIGLGFRRLAIVDLSDAAMQPLASEDGSVRILFNGEIYNHGDLRPELERLGHSFSTDHADGEVIVHGFEEWGIDCLARLRGMFAIAIWDDRAQELWLARDRIGVKPLYWSLHHGRLTFASEIKALLEDAEQERAVDEEALYHYLSFLVTPGTRTLFRGIRKLAGGTWLRVNTRGELREERYWDAWDGVVDLDGLGSEEIAGRVLAELRESVRLRKMSDVPVGVFLSGGIDSSTNTALFAEGEDRPVKTFSIGYDSDYPSYRNELDYARLMAERVGAEHHERRLTVDDLIEFLPRMAWLQDEPIADPVCVPVHYVSKLARDNGVVVAQVGEGADELFLGYPSWKTLLGLQRYDDLPVPRVLKHAGVGAAKLAGRGERREVEYLRRGALGQPIFWSGAESFTDAGKQQLLSPRLRAQLDGLTSWDAIAPIRARFDANASERSHLNWMTYVDLNLRLPELLLMRVDKMSMGVSLEARVPFLDHRFVELALSIPQRLKTNGGTLKHVLKQAVRGLIPDELIDRPKQGFGVPVHEWLLDRLGDETRRHLDDFCRTTDLLDRAEVMRLVDERRGSEVWTLLNLALWHEEFIAA
jgi:asparagine synthase (glutamine-hydrolysing)